MKNLHPIISLIHIYNPYYPRTLRILDFFLNIYLSFFFTLLPFYYTDNSQLVDIANNRDIQNRNKSLVNLEIKIRQVVQGIVYSTFASVCSLIISTILSLLLYKNVILEEAEEKRLLIVKALKKNYDLAEDYRIKIKNIKIKLRGILFMITGYRRKNKLLKSFYNDKIKINNEIKMKSSNENDQEDNSKIIDKKIRYQNIKVENILNGIDPFDFLRKSRESSNEKPEITRCHIELVKKTTNNNGKNITGCEKNSSILEYSNFNDKTVVEILNINHKNEKSTFKTKRKNDYIHDKSVKGDNSEKDLFIGTSSNIQRLKLNALSSHNEKLNKNINFYRKLNNNLEDSRKNLLGSNVDISCTSINSYHHSNLDIYNYDLFIKGSTKIKAPKKNYILFITKRSFQFSLNRAVNKYQISCEQISVIEDKTKYFSNSWFKTSIKKLLILIVYCSIWLYLMVFIQSIYKQYGNNIFNICVMPLIGMLVVKFTFTFSFMMLITTLILNYKGDYYLNKRKSGFITQIIFKALVPPLAIHHYSALRMFNQMNR